MLHKSTRTKDSRDTITSNRPFPRGFTPVLARKSAPAVFFTPEVFEPVFLPPTLRSPILEPDTSNPKNMPAGHRPQLDSRSSASSQAIKLIRQSVLKLKSRRSEPELSEPSLEEKPGKSQKLTRSRSFRGLTRSPSVRFRKRRSESESRQSRPENDCKKDAEAEEVVEGEEPEPVEELMAEAIKIAMCEKGHRRQRSREIPPVDTPVCLSYDKPNCLKLNFSIEPTSSFGEVQAA